MLKQITLKALQLAINQATKLDESMATKLFALDGRVIKVIIAPLDAYFFIQFAQAEIILLASYDGYPDTTIHSSPIGLIRLSLLPASKARSVFNDKVRMTGDVELGQQVKQLFDDMDIDWEGHLAHFTGDVVAHQIGSLVRKGNAFKNHFTNSMRMNITEYLQEELRAFPSRNEVEEFYKEVDELALSVERIEAQLKHV